MRYVSTRGGGAPAGFSDILLGGLMEDGGLAVPEHYPQVDAGRLAAWRKLGYRELALEILRLYADDIAAGELRRIVERTCTAAVFRPGGSNPPRGRAKGVEILGLSHRPTPACKDAPNHFLCDLCVDALSETV